MFAVQQIMQTTLTWSWQPESQPLCLWCRLLGVAADATAADIESASRKAAWKKHPEVSDGPDATLQFSQLSSAYGGRLALSRCNDDSIMYPRFFHTAFASAAYPYSVCTGVADTCQPCQYTCTPPCMAVCSMVGAADRQPQAAHLHPCVCPASQFVCSTVPFA